MQFWKKLTRARKCIKMQNITHVRVQNLLGPETETGIKSTGKPALRKEKHWLLIDLYLVCPCKVLKISKAHLRKI